MDELDFPTIAWINCQRHILIPGVRAVYIRSPLKMINLAMSNISGWIFLSHIVLFGITLRFDGGIRDIFVIDSLWFHWYTIITSSERLAQSLSIGTPEAWKMCYGNLTRSYISSCFYSAMTCIATRHRQESSDMSNFGHKQLREVGTPHDDRITCSCVC